MTLTMDALIKDRPRVFVLRIPSDIPELNEEVLPLVLVRIGV